MNKNSVFIIIKDLKYPGAILVVSYVISLLCIFERNTCLGRVLISCLGEEDQLFLVAYSFFAIRLVRQIRKRSTFSMRKIMVITLAFYGIILFFYMWAFPAGDDFVAAAPVLRTLFFGSLGGCFDLVK